MNTKLFNINDKNIYHISNKISNFSKFRKINLLEKGNEYILCSETNSILDEHVHVYYHDKLYRVLSLLQGIIINDDNKKIFIATKIEYFQETIQIINIEYNYETIDIILPKKMLRRHKTLWKRRKYDIYTYFYKEYFDKDDQTPVESFLRRVEDFISRNDLRWSSYMLQKIYKYICRAYELNETIISSDFLEYTDDHLYTYLKPADNIQINFTCKMFNNILNIKIEMIDVEISAQLLTLEHNNTNYEDEAIIIQPYIDIFKAINKFISYILNNSFSNVNIQDVNLIILDHYVDDITIYQDQNVTIIKNPEYLRLTNNENCINATLYIIENEHQIKQHNTLITISNDRIMLNEPIILITNMDFLSIKISFDEQTEVLFEIECMDFNIMSNYIIINQIMLDYSLKLKEMITYIVYYISCVKKIQKKVKESISNPNTIFGYNVIKRTLFNGV